MALPVETTTILNAQPFWMLLEMKNQGRRSNGSNSRAWTNKQSNKQTSKQIDATKRIISPASRSIKTSLTKLSSIAHILPQCNIPVHNMIRAASVPGQKCLTYPWDTSNKGNHVLWLGALWPAGEPDNLSNQLTKSAAGSTGHINSWQNWPDFDQPNLCAYTLISVTGNSHIK